MNKKVFIVLILALSLVVTSAVLAAFSDQTASSGGGVISGVYYLNDRSATTTAGVTFLDTAGASTTLVVDTRGINSVNINTQLTPSTTATNLLRSISYANGSTTNCVVTPLACDWYGEDSASVSGLVSTSASTTPYYQWNPQAGANATTTRNFTISSVGNRFTRIQFQVVGAAGAVWAAATLK